VAMRDIGSHARRSPKALGSRRSGRAGEPPEGVGKPCRCPASPAASLLPGGSPARSLWVIISETWYQFRKTRRRRCGSACFENFWIAVENSDFFICIGRFKVMPLKER
jgi:hypothetical protein